jgi:predicted SAM-dependent methyltransferase
MEPLRLHIGGKETKAGWKILNIQPSPNTDFVGNCVSLTQFTEGSVAQIYASHVYEHLSHRNELPAALKEAHRVLMPGGLLQISVPDFAAIARMILAPNRTVKEQYSLMGHLFGAQVDEYDYHKAGLTGPMLRGHLMGAGFTDIERVAPFGLFNDWSAAQRYGRYISVNMQARK